MDLEPLFVESKWGILKLLSEQGYSPLELAEKLNTSISNISQQLRLLEMAGLVQKVKVSNRDKGKPRMIFSVAGDFVYTVSVTRTFAEKKLVSMNPRQRMMMQILQLQDEGLQYLLEKAFWKLEEKFFSLQAFALERGSKGVKVSVVVPKAGDHERKGLLKVATSVGIKEVEYQLFTEEEFLKKASPGEVQVMYDTLDIVMKMRQKGGLAYGGKRR